MDALCVTHCKLFLFISKILLDSKIKGDPSRVTGSISEITELELKGIFRIFIFVYFSVRADSNYEGKFWSLSSNFRNEDEAEAAEEMEVEPFQDDNQEGS